MPTFHCTEPPQAFLPFRALDDYCNRPSAQGLCSFKTVTSQPRSQSFKIMAMRHSAILVLLSCLFLSTLSIHEEEMTSDFSFGSGLCDIVKCLKGTCVSTNAIPFYDCQCDAGWKSPLNMSWLPCVLPNCTIDNTCSNDASPAPPPPVPPTNTSDICSYSVCGNGDCIQNSTGGNSSDSYECKCDSGYSNLLNKSDGYCLRTCASIGANCQNLNISIGGSPQPPPPPPSTSSNQDTNQGSKQTCHMHKLMMAVTLALVGLWA